MKDCGEGRPGTDENRAMMTFPYEPPRAPGEVVDVTPEVKWLRMPMPYALDHVNVYLLRVEEGWMIVDTGVDSPGTRAAWEAAFSGPLRGETVVGVCCTHFHVDHLGLAGYLTERWRVPLFITYEEYFSLRGWPNDLQDVPWQHAAFFRQAGLPEELLPRTLVMFRFSPQISPLPPAFVRLREDSQLPGDGDWRVMIGRGHSPEQALLFSADRAILVSGDQLLPKISTNVSVSPVNPEDEPLSGWFATLDRLAGIPDDVLVLPGHGLPFRGARARVAELLGHHDRRFRFILDACTGREPSAYELTQMLYPIPLSDFDLQLALGECLSHVHLLLARGRLAGRPDPHGVVRYGSVPSAV
jgi:glyoxylase-like metal-dependent hydrolase (beta-lactamase superfamily II)